jgi:hypothetical protein
MELMITADDSVCDNQWWKRLFELYAKPGLYFEIHCWADEADALLSAARYGDVACFGMPDIKIVHGILNERLIRSFLREAKPSDRSCYNRMVLYFTVQIGSSFSSEKYGTEILLNTDHIVQKNMIEDVIRHRAEHIRLYHCD